MNTLRKKIRALEKDINKHRVLSGQQYKQAKTELRKIITSPAAFGIAFLTGAFIGYRAKPTKTVVANIGVKKKRRILPFLFNSLYIAAEIPNLLALMKKASKKSN